MIIIDANLLHTALRRELIRLSEATGESLARVEISYGYDSESEVEWMWTARVIYTARRSKGRQGQIQDYGDSVSEAVDAAIACYGRAVEQGLCQDARQKG